MDEKTISTVCQKVYQKFPDVKGIRPKVKSQPGDSSVFIFESKGTTASGKAIGRTVRVTVSASGKITKMSTSR